ncbi:GxxExxY protein [Pedobacter boryungensis]|uniref:GxxExxY protein n=1 Tax=Pedobacter boryungensis TaxID=869962 RepID=A0ABX2D9M8_9SPHI|nr:GxxExxY protein [Pedobacter boryungensis]NQX30768.1 GxxExxY protein [Pedobacter boryungensis]
MTKKNLNDLTYTIIGAAIEVHKYLGPGLLESAYQKCLEHELSLRGVYFLAQPNVPVYYKEIQIETTLRCDLFVENCIVIELKAVDSISPIFKAQLFTYMKLLEAPKGILINFNCLNLFKDGQQTYVNDLFSLLPE